MAEIGKMNGLPILRACNHGLVLDGGELGEILMPNRYIPDLMAEVDSVAVDFLLN